MAGFRRAGHIYTLIERAFIKVKVSLLWILVMVYHLSMFYLVRNEARYQSFKYFYGLVWFYIKVALNMNCAILEALTNLATPKAGVIPYRVKHISAIDR